LVPGSWVPNCERGKQFIGKITGNKDKEKKEERTKRKEGNGDRATTLQ